MKALIIYDSNGNIIQYIEGSFIEPIGVINKVITEIPEDKVFKGVNVETGEAILEDMPKTETELLQEKITQLENDMADLMLEMANQGGND